MKNGAYVVNLDKYRSIETHWAALYVNGNNVEKTLIALALNIFQKKLKIQRQQKYHNKYL